MRSKTNTAFFLIFFLKKGGEGKRCAEEEEEEGERSIKPEHSLLHAEAETNKRQHGRKEGGGACTRLQKSIYTHTYTIIHVHTYTLLQMNAARRDNRSRDIN